MEEPTRGSQSTSLSMAELALEETGQESKTVVADTALPTIKMAEDPQTVSDLLAFIDPGAKLQLMPETVEPLLEFAEMIGFDKLKVACAEYLQGRASWDPVATLRLAEQYRLQTLYSAAGTVLLEKHEVFSPFASLNLSDETIEKVSDMCLRALV